MEEIILHHYPLSLFAEKIRRILAYKGIPWRSVEQPMMAPKPDLTPLTGGQRRIPVMQIGADVYVDTACIARRIEALFPEPRCLPLDRAGMVTLIEDWADHRFTFQVVPRVIVELLPELPPGILDDRAAMSPVLSKEAIVASAPHAWSQALLSLDRLEAELREHPFLLGDAFTIADAACFHPLWFARSGGALFGAVTARAALAAWFSRIEAFGPGHSRAMTTAEALAIARDAKPVDVAPAERVAGDPLSPGDVVSITADDYGREESSAVLVRAGADEITIRRHDPTLGAVAVHFPRGGYRVEKRSGWPSE